MQERPWAGAALTAGLMVVGARNRGARRGEGVVVEDADQEPDRATERSRDGNAADSA